ncbi:MAG: 16S rRNA (cytidine(1402)-2'-O)-methyltransferase, partial [Corynebacterium variabile]|uniref:16S rRNA (cytidine(1402)-2'-O)-methyltransferase n=1 Tax=Corynebacterium variabile TaxID=1727 RepID=UPI003F935716
METPEFADLLSRAADDRPFPHGGIILAATPLGTALDASVRLIDALGSADIIAAEDTRRTRALADALGVEITGKVVSNYDHNESDRAAGLVESAAGGARVLVVTDAGMPAVSDPGLPLVQAAQEAGVPLTCLPGPSAVPTALALSGVGVGHFAFDGFAPRKDGDRRRWLETLVDEKRAVAFFESPHRLGRTLDAAVEVLGPDREAAVCRELTKTYEQVRRAPLGVLALGVAEATATAEKGEGPGIR